MSNFPQDIESARGILREQGENPEEYQFTMARNISDTYFSSGAQALYRVIVHRSNGAEQAYDLDADDAQWIPQFCNDLRENRFAESTI